MIGNVDRTGPAARAGLRSGDVLLAVNGEKVDTARGLIKAVAATAPGNDVKLSVRRQGRDMDVSITVGRRPNDKRLNTRCAYCWSRTTGTSRVSS